MPEPEKTGAAEGEPAVETLKKKGAAAFTEGRFQDSLDGYEKALELEPGDAIAWHGKGMALLKLDRPREALAACDRAIELDPKMPSAWRDRANALAKLGRKDEALKAFDTSIDLVTREAMKDLGKGMFLGSFLGRRKGSKTTDEWPYGPRKPKEKKD